MNTMHFYFLQQYSQGLCPWSLQRPTSPYVVAKEMEEKLTKIWNNAVTFFFIKVISSCKVFKYLLIERNCDRNLSVGNSKLFWGNYGENYEKIEISPLGIFHLGLFSSCSEFFSYLGGSCTIFFLQIWSLHILSSECVHKKLSSNL